MTPLFGTIKRLPRQRTLTEEVGSYSKREKKAPRQRALTRGVSTTGYTNSEEIQRRTSSNVSENRNFTDSLNKDAIRHDLLSMKSAGSPRGLLAVFASQRKIVSSAVAGNVPPEKKVVSVYMEVC